MNTDHTRSPRAFRITSWICLSIALIGIFLTIGGIFEFAKSQSFLSSRKERAEVFNPFDETAAALESIRTLDGIVFMTYEFASDFKDTDYYHIVFTEDGYAYIVKLNSRDIKQYQPLIDALYDNSEAAPLPEPVTFHGIPALIEDDIKEYAIEAFDYIYDESLTEDEFDTYIAVCLLDTTQTPNQGYISDICLLLALGLAFAAAGLIAFVLLRKKANEIEADEYDPYTHSYRQDAFSPYQPSNPLLGLIGAIFFSLAGVILWVIIGKLGFIAGIVGFVMLKLALKGYEKLGGGLDKKGAVISLIVAAFMIAGANVAEFIIELCQAYFALDTSSETVWFVIRSFPSLMTEHDLWGGFMINLAIGYVLSIMSCSSAIKAILAYRDPEF